MARHLYKIGSLRNLEQRPFDKLAAVLFAKNLEIVRAAIIPLEIVSRMSVYDKYSKGFRLMLEDALWKTSDVQDVTEQVRMAVAEQV